MPQLSSTARRRCLLSFLASSSVALAAFAPIGAVAQTYPDKPVKVVVGFAPGGTNDILARLIATKLQEKLKEPFVVENKAGANSAIGNDYVAKSKPDGYTLLVSSSGGLTTNPILMKNLSYDPVKDFEPVALLATFPLVITVPPTSPAKTFQDLVQLSKKSKDGTLNNGTPTTSFVLVAESLSSASGIKFKHIQYRGSGPVVVALLSGELDLAVLDSPAVVPQIKGGKLRAVAVTTGKRSSALPNVPTIAESGVPGYDVSIWTALVAPKGTPEPVLAKLRASVGEILKDPDTVSKMHALGLDAGDANAPALAQRISSDIARWTGVAKQAGVTPE